MTCKVCQRTEPDVVMRLSLRGRRLPHCTECVGLYRCIYCSKVADSNHFKTHSGRGASALLRFQDGERMRIAVCYQCDFKTNKERYSRYDRRVAASSTLHAFILNNFQRWKTRTPGTSLTRDFLVQLWDEQEGRCYYTGQALSLERGKGKWDSLSLDRLDPSKGYVPGNVVWTTRLVNTSKGMRTEQEFIDFCAEVTAYRVRRNSHEA